MSSSDLLSPDLEVFLLVRARTMSALAASPAKWADGQVAVVTSIGKTVAYSAATGEWHFVKEGH